MSLQFYVVNVGYGFLKMARPAVGMESIKQFWAIWFTSDFSNENDFRLLLKFKSADVWGWTFVF